MVAMSGVERGVLQCIHTGGLQAVRHQPGLHKDPVIA